MHNQDTLPFHQPSSHKHQPFSFIIFFTALQAPDAFFYLVDSYPYCVTLTYKILYSIHSTVYLVFMLLDFQASVVRGLEERLHAIEESCNDAEERLRVRVASNSALTAANAKLNTRLHTLNNDITELNAVSFMFQFVSY